MNLSDEVDLEDYVSRPDKISAADVSYFCTYINLLLYRFAFQLLKHNTILSLRTLVVYMGECDKIVFNLFLDKSTK
jgi:hypothetical protein